MSDLTQCYGRLGGCRFLIDRADGHPLGVGTSGGPCWRVLAEWRSGRVLGDVPGRWWLR